MSEIIRAEFFIEGLVQGVGFRYFVYHNAVSLGLKGFVKNCWDGSVQVITEGKKDIIGILHKHLLKGPMMAHVNNVKVEYSSPTNEFDGFEII